MYSIVFRFDPEMSHANSYVIVLVMYRGHTLTSSSMSAIYMEMINCAVMSHHWLHVAGGFSCHYAAQVSVLVYS